MKIIIPLEPRTKKNSQSIIIVKGKPMIIPSAKYKQYEKDCRPFIPKLDQPIDKPITLTVEYYMSTHRRVDLVNLLEGTCDMLVHYGVLKDDNSNIVKSHDGSRVKYDKEHPRCEIEIKEFIEHYSI